MPKNVKCQNCVNLKNDWCEKVVDSPAPDMVRDCRYFRQTTNADRIRAMSDEELVKFLEDAESGIEIPYCQSKEECLRVLPDIPDGECSKCLLAWLQQPAEEVHHE